MLEADFQRFYGLDLRVEFGVAGCRRLWALVDGLPTDAACFRLDVGWSHQDEMLALLVEHTDGWGRSSIEFGAGKKINIPGPVRIGRPKAAEVNGRSDAARVAAMFKTMNPKSELPKKGRG